MNLSICTQHSSSAILVCAEPACRRHMCEQCFTEHRDETSHALALILTPISIEFFLHFTDFLVDTVSKWFQIIERDGFGKVFSAVAPFSRYSYSKQSEVEISKQCLQVLHNYRVLIQNNKNYVAFNKYNLSALLSAEFINDISSIFLETWERIANNLAEEIKTALIEANPYKFSYKSIKFTINKDLLEEIDSKKEIGIQAIKEKVFISFEDLSKLQAIAMLNNHSGEAIVFQEIRAVSQNLKFVDSFEEILSNSFFDFDTDMKYILEESLETLSPICRSQESLERQLEWLLLQNEKLKQQNLQLRFQNHVLIDQNTLLKGKESL